MTFCGDGVAGIEFPVCISGKFLLCVEGLRAVGVYDAHHQFLVAGSFGAAVVENRLCAVDEDAPVFGLYGVSDMPYKEQQYGQYYLRWCINQHFPRPESFFIRIYILIRYTG